jgi:hypothetical protein
MGRYHRNRSLEEKKINRLSWAGIIVTARWKKKFNRLSWAGIIVTARSISL